MFGKKCHDEWNICYGEKGELDFYSETQLSLMIFLTQNSWSRERMTSSASIIEKGIHG